MASQPSPSKPDRKTIERNRRNHMKFLCSRLNSVIPNQNSNEARPLPDQLDEAANYIERLKKRLEKLKEKKEKLMTSEKSSSSMNTGMMGELTRSPRIEINEMGSALEVILITGLESQLMFSEIIHIFHQEGAEVMNASFSVHDNTLFHTIHSKVGESALGLGAAARISERLRKYVHDLGNAL